MRVLLVNDHLPGPGSGAEVHVARLEAGLRRAGDEVEAYAPPARSSRPGRLFDFWNLSARAAMRDLVDAFQPDVVHFHNIARELSPSVLRVARDAVRIQTFHDYRLLGVPDGAVDAPADRGAMRLMKMTMARLERIATRRALHAVIAPSRAIAQTIRRHAYDNVHFVPNFADPGPEPSNVPSSRIDIVSASRLSPEKGLADLIQAFESVAAWYPTARLILAGDGPDRERLTSLARATSDRISFAGLLDQDELRGLMETARVVVLPSLMQEVSPLAIIEAAFAGRPVVVSNDPGLVELVEHGEFGLIVPRRDVQALASALGDLLSDPARSDRLGAAGRSFAMRTRTTDAAVASIREVYRLALSRARPQPQSVARR